MRQLAKQLGLPGRPELHPGSGSGQAACGDGPAGLGTRFQASGKIRAEINEHWAMLLRAKGLPVWVRLKGSGRIAPGQQDDQSGRSAAGGPAISSQSDTHRLASRRKSFTDSAGASVAAFGRYHRPTSSAPPDCFAVGGDGQHPWRP